MVGMFSNKFISWFDHYVINLHSHGCGNLHHILTRLPIRLLHQGLWSIMYILKLFSHTTLLRNLIKTAYHNKIKVKVKSSLCTLWRHMGSPLGASCFLDSGKMSGQCHAPAALPPATINHETDPTVSLDVFKKIIISCPCQKSNYNSLAVHPVAYLPPWVRYLSKPADTLNCRPECINIVVLMQEYAIYYKRRTCNPFYTPSNTSQKELKIIGTFILYNFVCAWNKDCLQRKIICFCHIYNRQWHG
jgi:hypothetical protein